MTIRRRLVATAAATTLLAALLGLVLIDNARQVQGLVREARWAAELVNQASHLDNFTYDYLSHPSERAHRQWRTLAAALDRTLAEPPFADSGRGPGREILRKHKRWMDGAFERLVAVQAATAEGGAEAEAEAARELRVRLAGQIAGRTLVLEQEAQALSARAMAAIERAQRRMVRWTVAFVCSLVPLVLLSGLWIVRSIARPVAALTRGTAVVAGGDLSHRIGSASDDELGRLAGAFDRMTESLQETTVSRDALARSEQNFRQLLSESPFPMVVTDLGGRISMVNLQAQELFGYGSEELIGELVEVLVPERLRARHPKLRRGYMAAPRVRTLGEAGGLFGRAKDGREIPIELGLAAIEGPSGRMAIASIRDISERVRARREIERKSSELAVASRYKSEFLANMSHELRTPLNSLLILAAALARNESGHLDADEVQKAATIHAAGEDLLGLINDILDLSKVEAGKLDLQIGELELADLRRAIEGQFLAAARDRGLDFEVRIAPDQGRTLRTDRRRLEQILRNLIGNALKFTERGSVSLEIGPAVGRAGSAAEEEEEEAADGAEMVALTVSDTGIGIDPRQRRAIFEAFHQTERGMRRGHSGVGLGLAISRQLAGLLGGGIELESEPGRGSRFTLLLPRSYRGPVVGGAGADGEPAAHDEAAAVAGVAAAAGRAVPAPDPAPSALDDDRDAITPGMRSILIIEDDRPFAAILLERVRARGFRGVVAGEGTNGLALARELRPSAILLDLILPDLDGTQVLRVLQFEIETRHLPVQLISVRDPDPALLGGGVIGHLVKPVEEAAIDRALERIERLLESDRKRVLLLGDDAARARIGGLIAADDLELHGVAEGAERAAGAEAAGKGAESSFDLVIVGLRAVDAGAIELVRRAAKGPTTLPRQPVVVVTGDEPGAAARRALGAAAGGVGAMRLASSPAALLSELVLLLHRGVEDLPPHQSPLVRALHDPERRLRGRKLLLVDDDLRSSFALSGELRRRGIEVTLAESGEQALSLLEAHPEIELVIMDIMMPGMDGYQAMREIRSRELFADLPIVAITAKAMRDERARCIAAGADDYLAKPVRVDTLVPLLRVWLGGSGEAA